MSFKYIIMKKFLLILLNLVLLSGLNAYSKEDVEDSINFAHNYGLILRSEEVITNANSDYMYALEHNAYVWFKENYVDKGTGIVITLKDNDLVEKIKSCGTLWVVIAPYNNDKSVILATAPDQDFVETQYPKFFKALREHVAEGASLYLSNFATKLLAKTNGIGRLSDDYAPKDGQSAFWNGVNDESIWYVCPLIGVKNGEANIESEEVALQNHWNHPIYSGLKGVAVTSTTKTNQQIDVTKVLSVPVSYAYVKGKQISRKNVYCFWNMADCMRKGIDDRYALIDFQNVTHSIVLGTTEWARWYDNAGIVEFLPAHSADGKTVFDGTIIANGLAGCAYEVHFGDEHDDYEKNAYQINANALEYLSKKAFKRGTLKVKSIAGLNWIYEKLPEYNKEDYKDYQDPKACWSTLYCDSAKILPDSMEAYVISDMKNVTVTSEKFDKIKSQVAVLTKVAGNRNGIGQGEKVAILPAKHGYLLRTNKEVENKTIDLKNTKVAPTFSMDDYKTSYPLDDPDSASKNKINYLMGSEEKKTFSTDANGKYVFYILAGERRINTNDWSYGFYIKRNEEGDVYKEGTELENAAHRAFVYAPKPSDSENKAKPLLFSFDTDETTGIENLRTETRAQDGFCYNLAGQRVGKDYKGLVIKNGKKYLVK